VESGGRIKVDEKARRGIPQAYRGCEREFRAGEEEGRDK